MVIMIIVAVLLIINIILLHTEKLTQAYYWIYRKLKKPRFKVGEFVMINDTEFEIILIARNSRPYTYFCLPRNMSHGKMVESYYHEYEISKKTGLLKELE
jgi:hypothetical protein